MLPKMETWYSLSKTVTDKPTSWVIVLAVYAGAPDCYGTSKETAAGKGISMEFTYKTANVYVYEDTIPLTEAIGA